MGDQRKMQVRHETWEVWDRDRDGRGKSVLGTFQSAKHDAAETSNTRGTANWDETWGCMREIVMDGWMEMQ